MSRLSQRVSHHIRDIEWAYFIGPLTSDHLREHATEHYDAFAPANTRRLDLWNLVGTVIVVAIAFISAYLAFNA